MCRGTVLQLPDLARCEGAKLGCPGMPQSQTSPESHSFYERQLAHAWWFVMARIGQGLGERYQVAEELPPKLLALLKKLDDRDWLFPPVVGKAT
jgi:hypothetical protein